MGMEQGIEILLEVVDHDSVDDGDNDDGGGRCAVQVVIYCIAHMFLLQISLEHR
jgi:hypothetical protein